MGRKPATATACPCGGGPFADCCGPLLEGKRAAETAEQLMRSRYTAYALGRNDYLLATWHPSTRPASMSADAALKWIGLTVEHEHATDPSHAEVRFLARYRLGGRAHRMHEHSRFERMAGRWYYVDGDAIDA